MNTKKPQYLSWSRTTDASFKMETFKLFLGGWKKTHEEGRSRLAFVGTSSIL
jgi:hypothetical protein